MKKVVCSIALGALLTGCSAARFTLNKGEPVPTQQGVTTGADAPVISTTGATGTEVGFNCENISPSQQPAGHLVPLNQIGNSGQRIILKFDNRPMTAVLLSEGNRNQSMSFTYWHPRRPVSVFFDILKSNWVRVQPTQPEIVCLLEQNGATTIPQSIPLPFVATYTRDGESAFVKADFSNAGHPSKAQVGQFNLSCMKNRNEGRNTNAQLTLAEVNRVLCGVASVHLAP